LLRETPQGFAAVTDVDAGRIADGLGEVRRAATYGSLAKAATAAGLDRDEPGLVGRYYQRATMWREALPLLADAGLDLAGQQRFGEALPLVEDAMSAYENGGVEDSELEGKLRFARAQAYRFGGWPERAGADLEIAVGRLSGTLRIGALGYGGQVADDRQRPQESELYLARALYEAESQGEHAMRGSLLTLLARTLERLGFATESDAVMAKGLALLSQHGDQAQRYRGRYNQAWIAFDRGQARRADSLFTACADEAAELGGSDYVADVEAWLSRALFITGDAARALEVRDSAILHADRAGSTGPVFLSHMSLAEGAAIYGQYEVALEAADEMLGLVLRQLPGWENAARFLRAQALLGMERLDEASEEIALAMESSPSGIDGKRWRDKVRVLQMQIDTARGEPWPEEEALRLTDDLLGNNWYAAAVSLLTARAVHEKDPESGGEAAALAMQLGAPIQAARAVHLGKGWESDGADAVVAAVKVAAQNIPEEWRGTFGELPEIAPALAAPDVAEEDFRDAAAALDQQLQTALEEAGLSDLESLLSPAQRQARGLRRRRRRRPAWVTALAAAVFLVVGVGGGALAVTLLSPNDPPPAAAPVTAPPPTGPEYTNLPLPGVPPAELVRNQGYLATASGGPTHADLGFDGPVEGYYWKQEVGFPIRSSPITWGPYVIFGATDTLLYAVDIKTGDEKWTLRTSDAVDGIATVEDSFVYFGSTDGSVYARDALKTTAQQAWQFKTGGPVYGQPAVFNGVVYAGSNDGYLYALRAEEGNMTPETRELWRAGPFGEIRGGPLLAEGYVWVGSSDGFLRAINPASGVEHCNWNTAGPIRSSPIAFDGDIYVASENNNVWRVRADTCGMLLSYPSFAPVPSSPVILEGVSYVVPPAVTLVENPDGSAAIESFPCGQADDPETTAGGTQTTGALLYLAENEFLLAVDIDSGRCIWSARTGGKIEAAPAVARGIVYVGSRDGSLYALDAATGAVRWTYATGNAIETAPTLGPGIVYVTSTDGTLYALGDGVIPPKNDRVVDPVEFAPASAAADQPPPPPPTVDPSTATTITLPPEAPDQPSSNGGGGPNTM
jgi:outer membrane protein assembly factor BamB